MICGSIYNVRNYLSKKIKILPFLDVFIAYAWTYVAKIDASAKWFVVGWDHVAQLYPVDEPKAVVSRSTMLWRVCYIIIRLLKWHRYEDKKNMRWPKKKSLD